MIKLRDILEEATISMGQVRANPYATSFKSENEIVNEDFWALPASWSSPEAKHHMDNDVSKMSKILGKASQQVIKVMMDGVKGGKYDAMDLARGIQSGPVKRTHYGEVDFIQQLWNKVKSGFRRYSKRGKLR